MDENKKGYMQIKKWRFWGVLVLAFIVGGMFMSSGSSKTTTDTKSTGGSDKEVVQKDDTTKQEAMEETKEVAEPTTKQQVVVAEVSGNANKSSDTFRLSGGKVTVDYDFEGNIAIVGAIYLLKEGTSLSEDGGIPEVMVSEAGSDSTIVRKSAGDYYLQVNSANADYTVTVSEER